jgi:hypothetical protein
MTMMFDAKSFSLRPAQEPVMIFFGGGHTAETDPSRKGWRCRPAKAGHDNKVWIVGQPGKAFCASVMLTYHLVDGEPKDLIDVAIYFEDPKTVQQWINSPRDKRDPLDARYVQFPAISGCGLSVIQEIEKERATFPEHKGD